jgi:hypothetical protein
MRPDATRSPILKTVPGLRRTAPRCVAPGMSALVTRSAVPGMTGNAAPGMTVRYSAGSIS